MTFRRLLLIALVILPAISCTSPVSEPVSAEAEGNLSRGDIIGETVVTIDDGDFVHPAFSPDGKKLAYSGVVVEGNTELTEVFIHDLGTGQVTRLLNAKASAQYSVYKSYVISLEWKDNRTLTAMISDGDVDATTVTFDVIDRKMLSEEFSNGTADESIPEFSPLGRRAKATFTAWSESVLGSALNQTFIQLGDNALVVQKHHAREDDHIWRLDFSTAKITKLMDVPETPRQLLAGGFGFKDSVVFALAQNSRVTFFRHRDGMATEFGKVPTERNQGWIDVRRHSEAGVLFLLKRHRSYEQGHNPLYFYDSDGLREVKVEGQLYDAAVSPDGRLLCLALWRDGKRHLFVHRLRWPAKN